jgi:SUKH-3 immunity protein of toxin-antitoxin system
VDPCKESCKILIIRLYGASNRCIDVTTWMRQLGSVGYSVSPYARQAWEEFGNLNIRSASWRVPGSSLRVDPVDAGLDTVDKVRRLALRLQTTFAPLGIWFAQSRASCR